MIGTYRVEVANWNRNFGLLGIRYTLDDAKELAEQNDQFFVRILDCENNRKSVYRNYEWKDLTGFLTEDVKEI